jgi:hypothetical protein
MVLSSITKEEIGFSSGDSHSLAFELSSPNACCPRLQNACIKQ